MKWRKIGIGIALAGTTATGGTIAADQAVNPYTDKGTHYELPIKADIQQGERVEIAKDRAAVTLKGWNDEYAITVEPQIPSTLLGAKGDKPFDVPAGRPLLSKKMEFKSGDVTAFIEPKEGTENEFDIDFTLDAKPDTNVFTYKITGAEDFNFLYQPELTDAEIKDGAVRPENVVGSYAVYNKTHSNHALGKTNYTTGKVFHIYRPKIIDSSGAYAWATLEYNNGVLSVTAPREFLDTAIYPVTIDPTFGKTSIGGSNQFNNSQSNTCWTTTTSGIANVTMISHYNNPSSSGALSHVAIESDYSNEITGVTGAAWRDYTISSFVNNGAIRLKWYRDATGNRYYYDSTGSPELNTTSITYSSTFAGNCSAANSSRAMSIYATYSIPTVVFLTANPGTGNQTWTVPSDWSDSNLIQCIGSGGNGGTNGGTGGAGGGGGAYASVTNLTGLTPGGSATFSIGSSSTTTTNSAAVGMVRETYFNGSASSSASLSCSYGKYSSSNTAPVGGASGLSTGSIKNSGGNGGAGTASGGGGGGGSAGPFGVGRNGGASNNTGQTGGGGGGSNGGSSSTGSNGTSGGNGGAGGQGTGGTGQGAGGVLGVSACTNGTAGTGAGGGGGATAEPGCNGSIDAAFDSTHGAGGGGGGSGAGNLGGDGPTYGGGGGGDGSGLQQPGGQGIVVITYIPSAGGGGGTSTYDQTDFYIIEEGY